jgi:hypothetical protein
MTIALRTPKQNAPGFGDPRVFALPREIGVTDLRERIRSVRAKGMPHFAQARLRSAIYARRQTGFGEVMQHD